MTNLAIPWLESAQKRQEHGDRLDGLKGAQLRAYLAGHLKTGSGSNKRLASHYKQWVKVELPESEARQHLPLHHLPEQLVRNAASPSPSSQAVHAAPETAARSAAAASEAVRRTVLDPPRARSRAVLKQEGTVPPMPPGAFVKEEVVVPPMPPDAVVKREHTVVVKEEERSDGRAKRRRSK